MTPLAWGDRRKSMHGNAIRQPSPMVPPLRASSPFRATVTSPMDRHMRPLHFTTARSCGQLHHPFWRSLMTELKRRWVTPDVRSFGTFEAATKGCDKTLGSTDGFTFQGQGITCTAS
jgi:hypothetical protein